MAPILISQQENYTMSFKHAGELGLVFNSDILGGEGKVRASLREAEVSVKAWTQINMLKCGSDVDDEARLVIFNDSQAVGQLLYLFVRDLVSKRQNRPWDLMKYAQLEKMDAREWQRVYTLLEFAGFSNAGERVLLGRTKSRLIAVDIGKCNRVIKALSQRSKKS